MTDNVFLNRDKSKVVPAGSVEAKWQVPRKEAVRLGLLESEEKPVQTRRTTEPQAPQRRRNSARQGQDRGKNQDA